MSTAPGLWPRERLRPCESHAERRVYEALKTGLPKGWYAWHSLRIRTPKGLLGEGDFVVADPARGYVVLEVKGGAVEQRDGRWFQNGKAMDQAPLEQANTFVGKLRDRLKADGFSAPYGTAVCFPDASFDRPPSQDDLARVTLGERDLPWLRDRLPGLFDVTVPPGGPSRPFVDALHRLWGETWTPYVPLGTRAREEEGRWISLDQAQLALLGAAWGNRRVLMSGGAGSGKTVLAVEAARRFAAEGKRVLLCFTRSLATWLGHALAPAGVRVSTLGGLVIDELARAGRPVLAEPTTVADWDELCLDAVSALAGERFDAVIVDEAQDLTEAGWLVVQELARDGSLWAFQDERQRFWTERHPPTEERWFALQLWASHRCPAGVIALANRWLGLPGDEAAIRAAVADGTVRAVPSGAKGLEAAVAAELDRLLGEGLKPRDIAVVSVRGQTAAEAIFRRPSIGRHAFAHADDPDMGDRLVADTFLRLKGLERAAVIVTDLGLLQAQDRGVRLHIAATRARLVLRIVGAEADLARDPVLAGIGGTTRA